MASPKYVAMYGSDRLTTKELQSLLEATVIDEEVLDDWRKVKAAQRGWKKLQKANQRSVS